MADKTQYGYRIYLITGPSCAGKTSITINTFLNGKTSIEYKDIVWVTETEEVLLIGRYSINKRAKGTDAVARQDRHKIRAQVEKLLRETNKPIIIEGVESCIYSLWDSIKNCGEKCKLLLVTCSLETSIKRSGATGSPVSSKRLKGYFTTSANFFNKYADSFDGEVYDTDNVEDFGKIIWDFC